MIEIRLHRHPFAAGAPEVFEAESLAAWLLDRYEGRERPNLQVFTGVPSTETEVVLEAEAILGCSAPAYTVLETPAGGFEIIPFLINMAIATAVSAAVNSVFAPDVLSNQLESHSQESPNNQLSDRQNRVRVMERVEDIYGTVRSIPTLMMPSYFKYIANQKVEYGYYCITRGYADVSDVRDGDGLLSEISGASAAVYAPFTSPNSGSPQLQIGDPIIDAIVSVSRSSTVEGIVLKAQNQLQPTPSLSYAFRGPGTADVNGLPTTTLDVIYQGALSRRPNFAAICEAGQTVSITMPNTPGVNRIANNVSVNASTKTYTSTDANAFLGLVDGSSIDIGGFVDPANNGTKTVITHTSNSFKVAEAVVNEAAVATAVFQMTVNYGGTRTIAAVESGYITLADPSFFPADVLGVTGVTITVSNGTSDWTDWVTLPETDRTEVWTNVVAQQGMYKDDGAKSGTSVSYEVQIERLNGSLTPTGQVETISGFISGATSNERAETLERVTAWTGPARVRARRTTSFDYDFKGLVIDEIKWMDAYSVTPVSKTHFGNKTTIHTVTKTTMGSTAVRRRELNCLASRKLPTYNGSTFSGSFNAAGQLASGTISATSRIVDILAAVAADPRIGNRNVATDLDLAQIWATQQALDAWHGQSGQFNYTFDADTVSFEETVQAIANAAFCVAYRQNGKIRLALDRPQTASVALFTHRNKKPRAETITRRFASDSEYDGVELVYVDPGTEQRETIRLPLDGSYTKLKKVDTIGIRSYEQAWFRANREYRRLIGQRLSIDTEVTTDARALYPNARISVVDNTRFKAYDGEVVGQSGLTLTLSCAVEFLPATPHSIVLQKRDGSLQSIACTEVVSQPNQVLLAGAPAEAIVTTPTNEDGIRTVFSFAADSARAAQAWLVQELSASEGNYVRIRGVNYDANYYAADSLAIPAKNSVIN